MTRYDDHDIERLLRTEHDVEPPTGLAALIKAEIPEDLGAEPEPSVAPVAPVAPVLPFGRRILERKWLLTAATVVMTSGLALVGLRMMEPQKKLSGAAEAELAAVTVVAEENAQVSRQVSILEDKLEGESATLLKKEDAMERELRAKAAALAPASPRSSAVPDVPRRDSPAEQEQQNEDLEALGYVSEVVIELEPMPVADSVASVEADDSDQSDQSDESDSASRPAPDTSGLPEPAESAKDRLAEIPARQRPAVGGRAEGFKTSDQAVAEPAVAVEEAEARVGTSDLPGPRDERQRKLDEKRADDRLEEAGTFGDVARRLGAGAQARLETGLWAPGEPWREVREALTSGRLPEVSEDRAAALNAAFGAAFGAATSQDEGADGVALRGQLRHYQGRSPELTLVDRLVDILVTGPAGRLDDLATTVRRLQELSTSSGDADLVEVAAVAARAEELARREATGR